MNLVDYTNSSTSLEKFRTDLVYCLSDRVFLPSEIQLCTALLTCMGYTFSYNQESNPEELVTACEDFKGHFHTTFGFWAEATPAAANPSLFQLLLFNTLDFEKLPFMVFGRLEKKVKEDLLKRQSLLTFYREHKFIREYEKEGGKPTDQNEKILLEFYTRNLQEQRKILDYLLTGVKPRAITRAKISPSITFMADSFFDWPYVSGFPDTDHYFDHRQIDLVSHRLLMLDIDKVRALRPLYYQDKEEFYSQLAPLYPLEEAYRMIRYYLQILKPLSVMREPLFEELIELFAAKKYYGFYALALSQIEGIFSEMLTKINPQLRKGSLPDKVNALRPLYEKSAMNLDYYEHYIPTQRNKFMHLGLDDDIRLKAYDLLYDLPHLLSVYTALEVPIVKLTQTIKRRSNDPYFNEEGYVDYFTMLDKTKGHTDITSLQPEIDSFEKEFLSKLDLDFLATEFETEVPSVIKELFEYIKDYTRINHGKEVNMDLKTEHMIKTKTHEVTEELAGVYETHEELFERIERYRYFLDRCESYIPNMPKTAQDRLKILATKNKTDLNKVKLLLDAFKKRALASYGLQMNN